MSSLPKKESPPESLDPNEYRLTKKDILLKIKHFEEKYGISSEEFLQRWEEGSIEDSFETNAWAILLDYI